MKKFSEFRVGDSFFSTCSISDKELEEYLNFSRIKNAFLYEMEMGGGRGRGKGQQKEQTIISGRAILARMEGEFTRLSQIYGNHIILVGADGDPEWGNKNTRFLKPLYADQVLKIKFTISQKQDMDEEFGRIAVDYEGTTQDGQVAVVSKRNIYRIKKEPPT